MTSTFRRGPDRDADTTARRLLGRQFDDQRRAMSFAYSNRGDPVQVCIVPSGTELLGTCIPTGRPDTPILTRQSFGAFEAVVVLRATGEVGSADGWQDIPLTAEWQDVAWVNAPRP